MWEVVSVLNQRDEFFHKDADFQDQMQKVIFFAYDDSRNGKISVEIAGVGGIYT